MLKLGFIGAGTVGTALAARLSQSGYPVAAVASRNQASAQKLSDAVGYCPVFDSNQAAADHAELIFITTPDDAIAPWSKRFSGTLVRASSTAPGPIP